LCTESEDVKRRSECECECNVRYDPLKTKRKTNGAPTHIPNKNKNKKNRMNKMNKKHTPKHKRQKQKAQATHRNKKYK